MRVDLHIDELVLEGVPGHQREQVAAAIEEALAGLVAEQGLPLAMQKGSRLGSLTEQVKTGSRPESIGRQVAQAILVGFSAHLARFSQTKPTLRE